MNTAPSMRSTGRVKFFNSQKGYGFIIPDNSDVEVFVHHTAILNDGGFRSLAEGEIVEYDVVKGPKGWQASNVSGPNGRPVRGDARVSRPMFRPQYTYKPHPNSGILIPTSPLSPPLSPGMNQYMAMSPTSPFPAAPMSPPIPAYYGPHMHGVVYPAFGYPASAPLSPTLPQQPMYYPSPMETDAQKANMERRASRQEGEAESTSMSGGPMSPIPGGMVMAYPITYVNPYQHAQ